MKTICRQLAYSGSTDELIARPSGRACEGARGARAAARERAVCRALVSQEIPRMAERGGIRNVAIRLDASSRRDLDGTRTEVRVAQMRASIPSTHTLT